MKYILHYVNTMNRGGMETVIMNIYRRIDRTKYQFHFAVHSDEQGDFDKEIESLGGKLIRFPKFRANPSNYRKEWESFWEKNSKYYSVFHFHTNSLANIHSIKAAVKKGFLNIIIHAHSSYANRGKLQVLHDILHKYNQIYVKSKNIQMIAVSNKASNWVFGSDVNEKLGIILLTNGIDYEKYERNQQIRKKIREQLNLEDNFIIGHVGNFNAVKNHTFIVDVFQKIACHNKDAILLLIGKGKLLNSIMEKVEQLGLKDYVIFLGSVDNVEKYLNIMDAFIFPSKYEGLGLSLIEAQINGIPTIYSNTIPEEAIISSNSLPMSLKEDATRWAIEITKLAQRNETKKNSHIAQTFDLQTTVEKIEMIYSHY